MVNPEGSTTLRGIRCGFWFGRPLLPLCIISLLVCFFKCFFKIFSIFFDCSGGLFFMPRSFELLFSKLDQDCCHIKKRVPTSADTLNISIFVSVFYDISYLCKILLIQYFFHSSNIHNSHYTKYNA